MTDKPLRLKKKIVRILKQFQMGDKEENYFSKIDD